MLIVALSCVSHAAGVDLGQVLGITHLGFALPATLACIGGVLSDRLVAILFRVSHDGILCSIVSQCHNSMLEQNLDEMVCLA